MQDFSDYKSQLRGEVKLGDKFVVYRGSLPCWLHLLLWIVIACHMIWQQINFFVTVNKTKQNKTPKPTTGISVHIRPVGILLRCKFWLHQNRVLWGMKSVIIVSSRALLLLWEVGTWKTLSEVGSFVVQLINWIYKGMTKLGSKWICKYFIKSTHHHLRGKSKWNTNLILIFVPYIYWPSLSDKNYHHRFVHFYNLLC